MAEFKMNMPLAMGLGILGNRRPTPYKQGFLDSIGPGLAQGLQMYTQSQQQELARKQAERTYKLQTMQLEAGQKKLAREAQNRSSLEAMRDSFDPDSQAYKRLNASLNGMASADINAILPSQDSLNKRLDATYAALAAAENQVRAYQQYGIPVPPSLTEQVNRLRERAGASPPPAAPSAAPAGALAAPGAVNSAPPGAVNSAPPGALAGGMPVNQPLPDAPMDLESAAAPGPINPQVLDNRAARREAQKANKNLPAENATGRGKAKFLGMPFTPKAGMAVPDKLATQTMHNPETGEVAEVANSNIQQARQRGWALGTKPKAKSKHLLYDAEAKKVVSVTEADLANADPGQYFKSRSAFIAATKPAALPTGSTSFKSWFDPKTKQVLNYSNAELAAMPPAKRQRLRPVTATTKFHSVTDADGHVTMVPDIIPGVLGGTGTGTEYGTAATNQMEKNLVNLKTMRSDVGGTLRAFNKGKHTLSLLGRVQTAIAKGAAFLSKNGLDPTTKLAKHLIDSTVLKTESGQLFNEYRRYVTGAAAAMKELNWLLQTFANPNMDATTFNASLETFDKKLIRTIDLLEDELKGRQPTKAEFNEKFDAIYAALPSIQDSIGSNTNTELLPPPKD